MSSSKKAAISAAGIDAPPSILAGIGLYGLSPLEPVILAALATEEPLLLIGPHGTGKSLLLLRIAKALELELRRYNASLLNFDDLVGFPLPGKDGSLEYVKTPASIWGAGAVIFDEISRCRPDIQNKLFPIVHERRAQGILLEDLRYRWAAMNPPSSDDDDEGYLGSEPLDPALADRFAFIAEMPSWENLSEGDQISIISANGESRGPVAASALRRAVATTRASIPVLRMALGDAVAAGHGVEFADHGAGPTGAFLGGGAEFAQVDVPGGELRPGVHDGDHGLAEVFGGVAHGSIEGAGIRVADALEGWLEIGSFGVGVSQRRSPPSGV